MFKSPSWVRSHHALNHLLTVVLLSSLLFTACEPDEIRLNENFPNEEMEGTAAPAAFAQMLADINALRAEGCRCGNQTMPPVGPLRWNNLIANAAARHSSDMADNRTLNHTGSDGSTAGDRLVAAGYHWQQYGENIASGFTSARAVLQGWVNSPGHCRNLMGANFTELGAARKDNYWTQVFAQPR